MSSSFALVDLTMDLNPPGGRGGGDREVPLGPEGQERRDVQNH